MMNERKSKRQYPLIYEKVVPVAIGVLTLVVIAMLIFTIAVGTGTLSFS